MPEPNPVWGVHVVQGAVTAALVRRTGPGAYEILDAIGERAPEDPVLAMRQAQTIVSRRAVLALGAFVTLPDAAGCLVTATVPPDEFDLSEHEISNEMYEWTRFEPDQAELRHNCVLRETRRQERLVAAIPRADYRRYLEVLERGDVSRLGVGMSGVAMWRGALAMGLVPADGLLVAMLPHVTEVYVAPGGRARRHLLPLGEADLARDATAVDLLARDLAQLADYHRSLRRSGDKPPADPRFVLAGLSAASPAVRPRLAGVLGPRIVDGSGRGSAVSIAPGAKMPNLAPAALAGAVGAALEALRPTSERLVLRHLPADLPAYRDRRPIAWTAATAAVVAAALLVVRGLEDGPATGAPARATPSLRTAPPEIDTPASPPDPVVAEPPSPAPPPGPAVLPLAVDAAGPGRVRVRWPQGVRDRSLNRRFLGTDGKDPDRNEEHVRSLDPAAGEIVDDVPGPSGFYVWSADGAADATAYVEVRVEVELLGRGDAGGARFVLQRPWHGGTATLEVDIAPGGRVAGADGLLTFDSGWRLGAVRTRLESERAAVRVPRFLADGHVQRGGDGSPVTVERVVERERRIFEAEAVAPDGTRRTWLRKMTDG